MYLKVNFRRISKYVSIDILTIFTRYIDNVNKVQTRLAEAAVLRWCLVLHHSTDDVTLDSGSLLPSIKQTAAHKVIFASSKWYILFFLKRSRYLGN